LITLLEISTVCPKYKSLLEILTLFFLNPFPSSCYPEIIHPNNVDFPD